MVERSASERIAEVKKNAPDVAMGEVIADVSRGASLAVGFELAATGGPVGIAAFGTAVAGGFLGAWIAEKIGAADFVADTLESFGMQRIGQPGPDGPNPATKGHQIAHSYAFLGFLAAVVIGVAIGAAVIATGGAAAAVVIGAAAAGGLAGGFLGSAIGGGLSKLGARTGMIIEGSPDVFIEGRAAARWTDKAMCAKEPVPVAIVEGSETIFVNGLPLARVGHKLICGAVVDEGATSVVIDETTIACAQPAPEVPVWARVAADWVGFLSIGKGSAHLSNKNKPPVKPQKPPHGRNNCNGSCGKAGEPVHVLSGAVTIEGNDFFLPWRIALDWNRYYFSNRTRTGTLGVGWECPADIRLELLANGAVHFWDGGEFPILFAGMPRDGTEVLESLDGNTLCHTGGVLSVETKSGRTYRFTHSSSVRREWLVSEIEDRCGNRLTFVRDQQQRLHAIRESSGTRLEFHEESGHLRVQLVHPSERESRLLVEYERDEHGDLVAVRGPLGHTQKFDYRNHCIVRTVNRRGQVFRYRYDEESPIGRCLRAYGDKGHFDYQFEYDEDREWVRYRDSLGHWTELRLDEHGYPLKVIDPLGGVTSYTYNDAGQTTSETDPCGRETSYDYDDYGDLLRIVRPDGREVKLEYSDHRVVSVVDARGGTWLQSWDPRGLLLSRTSPTGSTHHYEYTRRGDLSAHVDPRGYRSEYESERYYGALRVERDPLGAARSWERDVFGNCLVYTDAAGAETRYTYDNRAQIVRVERPEGAHVEYAYDGEGNLVAHRNENGHVTRLAYTGINEVARKVLPDGSEIHYEYDTEDRLVRITNAKGQHHELRRDAAGRVIEEIDYWGQSTRWRLDASGLASERVDALGQRLAVERDELGRVVRTVADDDSVESYTYDPAGFLVEMGNDDGFVRREYDADGRLLAEHQREITIEYAYDASGNCRERTTSLGNTVCYEHDPCDRLAAIEVNGRRILALERDRRGLTVTETLANTRTFREVEYDALQRVVKQTFRSRDGGRVTRRYEYDAASNLTRRVDSQAGVDAFLYDPLGRIVRWTDPEQAVQSYTYERDGGLEREHGAGVGFTRVSQVGDLTYHHDARGQVVRRMSPDGVQELVWDRRGRLRTLQSESAGAWRYAYDAQGRRTEKQGPEERTEFFWDDDRLIAERTGDQIREYVYTPGSFEPLAMIAGKRAFVLNVDPVGIPREAVNEDGVVVWSARYDALGRLTEESGTSGFVRLRFPGQYHDAESGLYYNRNRYFDPRTKEFISVDPLGIAAGENTFEYGVNVWGWIDPLGLSTSKYGGGTNTPKIRNSHLAGGKHPKTGIPFDKNGFPDFSSVSVANVKIKYTGSRPKDFKSANEAAGYKTTPEGYTWHHHQDGTTMQLVPTNIHAQTGHTGGYSLHK